jgi:hypothetical protein
MNYCNALEIFAYTRSRDNNNVLQQQRILDTTANLQILVQYSAASYPRIRASCIIYSTYVHHIYIEDSR